MEGIIKLVGQVTDIFSEGISFYNRERFCCFTLECDSIWQKSSEDKEYSQASISAKQVDVSYFGAVSMSQSESDKFGFTDDMLNTDVFGTDVGKIRCGHQVEVYVQWQQTETFNHQQRKTLRRVVVIDKTECPMELNDLLNQL